MNHHASKNFLTLVGVGVLCCVLLGGGAVVGLYRQQVARNVAFGNAIDNGNSAVARELLQQGVDPTKFPNPIDYLECATLYCDPATVQAIINTGVPVNGKSQAGFTALHYAVIHRRSDMVVLLLKNGADVRAKLDNGQTPLMLMSQIPHRFARKGNDPTILRLLQAAERKAGHTSASEQNGLKLR